MMQLYNKLSAKERAALIEKAGKRRITLSFYKYHQIENTSLFRDHLYLMWEKPEVLGRIYVASEGINAQLSVPSHNFNEFKINLDSVRFLKEIRLASLTFFTLYLHKFNFIFYLTIIYKTGNFFCIFDYSILLFVSF